MPSRARPKWPAIYRGLARAGSAWLGPSCGVALATALRAAKRPSAQTTMNNVFVRKPASLAACSLVWARDLIDCFVASGDGSHHSGAGRLVVFVVAAAAVSAGLLA